MEQNLRDHALAAAIQEGLESGVSDRTVPDIMKAVEARLRADGCLRSEAKSDHPPKEG